MRLKALELEGFKTFAEKQVFDFTQYPDDGLCFVTGNNKVDPELGANGAGKCLPSYTMLQDAFSGERATIQEWLLRITAGSSLSVWGLDTDHRLRPTLVTDVFSTGQKQLLRLHLTNGSYQDLSETHPVITSYGQSQASELSCGDLVMAPSLLQVNQSESSKVCLPSHIIKPLVAQALADLDKESADRWLVKSKEATCELEGLSELAALSGHLKLLELVHADIYWTRVDRIETLGIEPTFDISVSNETHLYALDNIITHNSSIFDGLTTAFYGKTSRGLKAGDVASWQVAHELADKAEAAIESGGKKMTKKAITPSVTTACTFENYNGDECHINRRWNPNVLTLQVGDGEPKNVDQAEIDSMIGYNFDEFLQAAYFSQFQDLFLDMGSAERSALVAKVLNLDVWDIHSDSAKQDADTQKAVIENDRKAIERLKGQIEELEAQDLSDQIAEWQHTHDIELKGMNESLTQHKKSEKKLKDAFTKADDADKAQDEIVSKLEDDLEATVKTAIKPLQDELAVILVKSDEDLKLADELDDDNDDSDKRDFKSEIRVASKEESRLAVELASLEKDMDKIEAKAKKVEALEGDCSSCGQPITEDHVDHELDNCDKELETIEAQADSIEVSLKKAKRTLKALEKESDAADDARKESALKQKRVMSLLRTERADTERDYADRLKTKETEVRAESREALKAAQATLTKTTADLTTAKTAKRDWTNALEDLVSDVEDCEDEKNPHAVLQAKNADRLEGLNKERENSFDLLEAKVEDESASRYWVRGFKSVKLFAVSNALNELEAEVNSALDGLGLGGWSVEFDVDKENKSGTLSKGFFAFINGPDNLEPVKWEAWSGGESQRLRLAASLGLANMIRSSKGLDLPFEIWDEPSQWMSDAGITGLLDVLQRRAKRLKRQIWLIDHRGLEHPFDAAICVTKTLEGSKISDVTNTFGSAD